MSVPVLSQWRGQHGWARLGSVPPGQLGGATFWSQAARVDAVGAGIHVDAVHTFAGLQAGPSGARATDGSLAALLTALPRNLVAIHLGALSRRTGLGLRDREWAIGLDHASDDDIRRVFGLPEEGLPWHEDARDCALEWVNGLGALLADPATHRSHGHYAGEIVRARASQPLRTALGWGWGEPAGDPARRRAGALAIALSGVSARSALQLVLAAGPNADSMLDVMTGPSWPGEFNARAGRLRLALQAESWGSGG